MPELTVVRNFNASWSPSYIPVAVFVGGTSGIGEAMVKALAHYTSGRVHLIIVGRNRSAAEKTFASISNTTENPSLLRQFIYCDATLMTNIEVLTKQISGVVSKINFLVLLLGYVQVWTGRNETEEGIDRLLGLRYYSRFKIIHELLPLLHKVQVTGEDAEVMSILGAASGVPVNFDDLGVKKSWWGGCRASFASAAYNDIMVEEYAKRNQGIVFTHIWPGAVNTAGLLRLLSPLVDFIIRRFMTAPEECAEHMLFALLEGKEGFYLRDYKGNAYQIPSKWYSFSDEQRQAVWIHSVEVTRCG
ncbi:NAD-P-binding protein [Armillaria luteobubalina]|uniref:NAD-P-binding protein n=1 Tax=Armillaria luteobubalina TaxID=153913 RepID=A0AA39UWL7_9AGAR|nr:NAD-P-binding protein [Armillaria luteobubalina]